MVEWSSNFLQRIPGFELVRLFQGQSEDSNKKVKVEIPACFAAETKSIMDQLFPESNTEKPFVSIAPHSSYAFVLMTIFGLLGLAIMIPAFVMDTLGLGGIVYAIYLMLVWFLAGKYVKSVTLSTNGELIIYRRGWMFMDRTVIKSYKVQTLQWSQNILQKQRGTAHLTLNTAAGSRTLRFFPVEQVRELHDFFLYKIESSEESWM
jgi:putative membrane protein